MIIGLHHDEANKKEPEFVYGPLELSPEFYRS